MVGNEIARRTSFIHRAAYLRDIIGLLWRYAPYTFRIWFDFLSILFFFGDFGRGRFPLREEPVPAVSCGRVRQVRTSTVSTHPPCDTDTVGLQGFPTLEGKPSPLQGQVLFVAAQNVLGG